MIGYKDEWEFAGMSSYTKLNIRKSTKALWQALPADFGKTDDQKIMTLIRLAQPAAELLRGTLDKSPVDTLTSKQ